LPVVVVSPVSVSVSVSVSVALPPVVVVLSPPVDVSPVVVVVPVSEVELVEPESEALSLPEELLPSLALIVPVGVVLSVVGPEAEAEVEPVAESEALAAMSSPQASEGTRTVTRVIHRRGLWGDISRLFVFMGAL
jgi:hypothetical protein